MRLLAGLVSGLVVWVLATTAASAAQLSGSIAMYSDPGDYVGQGEQQVWAHTAAAVTGNPGDVTVSVSDGSGNAWDLEFAAPPGQNLQPGVYDNAARAPFRGSSPGIDISGAGRGCNTDTGRFEVKDVGFDASGNPTRLWIIFEQHCEGAPEALFGEVRLGEPADGSAVQSAPSLVRWPANDFGTPETVVPVQFVASHATSIAGASITGADPSDFRVSADGCGGTALTAGQICTVYVGFVPTGPGLRTATLQLTQNGGGTDQVPLQGWTYGGATRLVMNSDQGDYIGNGQSYSYSPATATLDATGTPQHFSFSVQGSGGDWWNGDFSPSKGQIFTAGSTWMGAARDAFRGNAPGMDVGGDGRGCNTVGGQFTVTAATYSTDGTMKTFAVRFEQHCEGAGPALRGEFDWRLNDDIPAAPWMDPSDGGSGSPTPGGASTNSTTVPSSATTSASARRVLVSSLAALLAQRNANEHRALALLMRASGTHARRRNALRAINRLLSLVATARADLSRLATKASLHPTRNRVLRALATWQRVLVKERSLVRSSSPLTSRRMRALGRAESADASAALRALGRLRKQM